ncbi:porin [Ramlibacter sp. MAHUQ-53]|uniref:porin n=1 Tax=unclassified Ramlibacter TaxID=2617605 RepID=UPI00362F7C45
MAALTATSVFAQSSVTLSGQIDVGLSNPIGADRTRIDQSANGANQIVFSGSEDLGGGLRATFRLAERFSPESGLNDGSNANRPLFQGESTVGIAGTFGALRIGRALTAFQGPINNTDPWGTLQQASLAVLTTAYASAPDNYAFTPGAGGVATLTGTGGNLGRSDGIFYTAPNWNGFGGALTYGPKSTQVTGLVTTGDKALLSGWLSYGAGPMSLAIGAERNRIGDRIAAVQGSYNFGFATLGGTYAQTDYDAAGAADRRSFNVSAVAPMGAFTLKAGVGRSKLKDGPSTVRKIGLGVDYSMSKRTLIYTSWARDNGVSASTGLSASPKTGFDIGIRHNF